MASFKCSSDAFFLLLGFNVKLDLKPHFFTISRSNGILSITLVGSEYKHVFCVISTISIMLSESNNIR